VDFHLTQEFTLSTRLRISNYSSGVCVWKG